MIVVCLSDTHGNHGLPVPQGDLLLHSGDLSRGGSWQELEQAACWLKALPHPHKVVIAGNHDFGLEVSESASRALFAPIHYLQDEEVNVAGLRIYGSPWTPTFGGVWAFQAQDLKPVWEKIPHGIDILLTHGPPAKILDRTCYGSQAGCRALAEKTLSVRPKLHVFGHIHEAWGIDRRAHTLHVNASNSGLGYAHSQPAHVLSWDGAEFRPI